MMFLKRFLKRAYKMEDPKSLEERVRKLEYVFGEGARDTVRETQQEILKELYELRDALQQDLASSNSGPVSQEVQNELSALREENQKLKYRISHLKKHIS